jgi:ABC-type nitrate/sulfonate/bicarbonate transport system permease component
MKRIHWNSIATTIAIVAVWQAASSLSSPLFLPGPLRVMEAFRDTYPGIVLHALATLARTLTGFVLGVIIGISAGLLMSWNPTAFNIVDPIVESLRPVPAIAAIPLFILWFGTGSGGQILLIALSCGTVLAVDVFHAVRNVSPWLIRAAQTLGAGRGTVYRTVIGPAIIPSLSGGLRIIAALSFTIAIASEFMGAQLGLGFVIMRARRSLETQTIVLGMLLIGLLARASDLAIRRVLVYLTRWSETSTEAL